MTDDATLIPLEASEPDEPAPGTGARRRLTPLEQLQVCIWIVDGCTNQQIRAYALSRNMPALSDGALTRYRRDETLLEEARRYLRQQVTTVGLAERAVRVRRLQRHAEHLERLIAETDLIEVTEKVVAFGKKMDTILERKFAAALSKEYRETLEQIRREVEPLERVVVERETNTFLLNISDDDKRQILEALKWVPNRLPHIVAQEAPVEGELVAGGSPDPVQSPALEAGEESRPQRLT